MPHQRSRSEEREKKQRQRRWWSEDKKEENKAKDRTRKREKISRAEVERIFKQGADVKKVVAEPKFGRDRNVRKEELDSKELSEYEIIRHNNINERLEGMVGSGLWSKEEVAVLKKRYLL